MPVTCPTCGNDRLFLVKTLQVHVVKLDEQHVDVQDETRPQVLEFLCDDCETALPFEAIDDRLRREIVLTLGAR